jgi:hypothetical protein
MIALGFFLVLS